jgi:hypothetical protein
MDDRSGRISLEMALWAMRNAGYAREETEECLVLNEPKSQEETEDDET